MDYLIAPISTHPVSYIHQLEKEQEQLRVEIERHATAPVQEENGANDGSEDLRERVEVNTGSSGKIQAGGIRFVALFCGSCYFLSRANCSLHLFTAFSGYCFQIQIGDNEMRTSSKNLLNVQ